MKYRKTTAAFAITSIFLTVAFITSCSKNPTSSSDPLSMSKAALSSTQAAMKPDFVTVGGPPGYEPAYVNDTTVWINAIEVKQNPTDQAQADFYEIVYPFDPATGEELTDFWPSDPQCNPCDHQLDGDTPDDYHDHVLDSRPSDPTGREYNALWHVYVIMPNYNDDADHNASVNSMLQSMLPVKSEDEADGLLSTMVDGMPLAVEIDTHFYFICDVVSPNAALHSH